MLADDYRMFSQFSLKELNTVWKKMGGFSVLIGGWAAHLLVRDAFRDWKKIEYIGSKDIDFGISLENIKRARVALKSLGFSEVSFRFYKIFDIETKKEITENIAKKRGLHEIFYVYVDLIAGEKNERYPYDGLIDLILKRDMTQRIGKFIVPAPEALILLKLHAIKYRKDEKLVKDLLDILMISNFSKTDKAYFREISSHYPFDKNAVASNINKADEELSALRLSPDEIRTAKTVLLSLIGI